jgi:hypothetical protein
MKKTPYLAIALMVLSACQPAGNRNAGPAKPDSTPFANATAPPVAVSPKKPLSHYFTLEEAAKVLGEPAQLEDSSTVNGGNAITWQCAYKAMAKDTKSKKTGTVYFLISEYTYDSAAHNRYQFIKAANRRNGIKVIDDLGDEAYFHTDNKNFYFIMVRKGKKVFNMKVNKVTANTSLAGFNRISMQIADKL